MKTLLENIHIKENYDLLYKCIVDRALDDVDLPIIYRLFYDEQFSDYHILKNKLLTSIKKYSNLLNLELFCNALEININQANELLNTEAKIAYFPVVERDFVRLSSVYLYETNDIDFPLTFPNNSKEIKATLKKVVKAADKSFFVSFESEPFTDVSFSLSVAAALLVKRDILEYFILTGSVFENGEIGEVGFIKEKESFAKEQNKLFVSFNQAKHIDKLIKLNTDTINLPFIQLFGKDKKQLENNFNYFEKSLDSKDKIFIKIIGYDWLTLFNYGHIENKPEQWEIYLKDFVNKIKYLDNLPFKVKLHFLCSLSAFAFAMGVVIGAKRRLAIYHFQDDEIYKIFDFINNPTRSLKEKKKNLEILQYKKLFESLKKNEVCFSIFIAGHNPGKDAEIFIKKNLKCPLIQINLLKFQGNLSVNDTYFWFEVVRELFLIIDNAEQFLDRKIERYHFIFSTPVPIAFSLGMVIGDYKKASIYNFDKKTSSYIEVLNSDTSDYLKNIF